MRRSLICNYEVRYRWMHEILVNRDSNGASVAINSGKSAGASESPDTVENLQIPNHETTQEGSKRARNQSTVTQRGGLGEHNESEPNEHDEHNEHNEHDEHDKHTEHDKHSEPRESERSERGGPGNEHARAEHQHAHKEHTLNDQKTANAQGKPRKSSRRRKGPTSVKRKIGQEVASQIELSPEALQRLPTEMDEVPFDTDEEQLGIPQVDDPKAHKQFKKFLIRNKHRRMDEHKMRILVASGNPNGGNGLAPGGVASPHSASAGEHHALVSEQQVPGTPHYDHTHFGPETGGAQIDHQLSNDDNSRIANSYVLHSPLLRSYTVADPAVNTIESIFPPPGGSTHLSSEKSKHVSSTDMLDPAGLNGIASSSLSYRGHVDPDLGNGVVDSLDLGTEDAITSLLMDPLYSHVEGDSGTAMGSFEGAVDPSTLFAKALKRTPSAQVLPALINNTASDDPLGLNFDSGGFAPLSGDSQAQSEQQIGGSRLGNSSGNIHAFPQEGFLANLADSDHFLYFVDQVADDLVPIPFEESPYFKHLPAQAQNDKLTWDLLVAFGATHRAVRISTDRMGRMHPLDATKVETYIQRCEQQLEYILSSNPQSHSALLGATLLAMIEQDRGSAKRWWYYLDVALHIIRLRPSFADWELDNEINSMLFRLVGFMTTMANLLCGPAPRILAFPSWPQWSGSLDHLTGVDLNLLPLFSEVAFLAKSAESHISRALNVYEQQRIFENKLESPEEQRQRVRQWTFNAMISNPTMQKIRLRAMRIFQRINDYWIEEFTPDSDITAMCILFQESLQIHLLRKVLLFPASHPVVQRLINLGMRHLETFIAPQSPIQRNMAFILATLASEAIDLRHRTVLLIRLRNMAEAGFKHHWRLCRDLKQHWGMNKSLICSRAYTLLIR